MRTVQAHDHSFSAEEWPFSDPPNSAAFTTARVVRGGGPMLLAFHDHDGDWQFLHGEVEESDEVILLCLGCAFQRDRTIGALADLPRGWAAERAAAGAPWMREPFDEDEDVG